MNKASNTKNKPFFSVVIPTLNEEKYLPLLLEDLSNQTNNNFEVIHIDGNSDDKTIEVNKKFKKILNIRTKITKTKNVSFQRNLGAELSAGEWVIFMDADNRLNKNFLKKLERKISKNINIDIFTTLIEASENKILEKWANFWLLLNNNFKKKAVYGSMIGVKKNLSLKYPFDKNQKIMEDVIFVQKIIDAGYIFEIFKNPKYQFSFRRINSKSFLRNAESIMTMTMMSYNYYIKKEDFKKNNFGYKMNGGSPYKN